MRPALMSAALFAAALSPTGAALAESAQSGAWSYTYEPSSGGKSGLMTAFSPAPAGAVFSAAGFATVRAKIAAACGGGEPRPHG